MDGRTLRMHAAHAARRMGSAIQRETVEAAGTLFAA
jgi:hypothetical protein